MGQIHRVSADDALVPGAFAEFLDVRSPSEFDEDHLPGAINLPVLDDAQRREVGTVFKQVNPFQARRIGAPMVSRNIAGHLERHFAGKERDYHPLVYCWRGGERSNSMATVLASIGWRVGVLDGGYKAYRQFVRDGLERLCAPTAGVRLVIVGGLTGSGKTELLRAMAQDGAQVLDLEALANHRGSLLGREPGEPGQPSQKAFESGVFHVLSRFDRNVPVFIEAESNKIGNLHVPPELWRLVRASPLVEIDVPREERARFLIHAYPHFCREDTQLLETLAPLRGTVGNACFERWEELARAGEWQAFVEDLLTQHYDPAYTRSRQQIFQPPSKTLRAETLDESGRKSLAESLRGSH